MPAMDNHHEEKENSERRNSNTEYLPTKCRITRPPPPKPATNPLQFIKVAPCALYRKAQEQIKKVEDIKTTRQEIREDAEDWQQNLDNWKSSRRKRQEHIIERVVEVKKFEQEEHERSRRKSKTFNEMMEERSRGRHKFNITIYTDDDSNDLSDYGIGSSSSKTNSIKDVDTDDSNSLLDDNNTCESPTKKESSSTPNQSQSEDNNTLSTCKNDDDVNSSVFTSLPSILSSTYTTSLYTTLSHKSTSLPSTMDDDSKLFKTEDNSEEEKKAETKVYTYEGAIQDYRARMKSKVNLDDSIFNRSTKDFSKSKEYTEAQTLVPKGQIFKRKELFEIEKPIEINHYDSTTTRRLTDDFINAQSIKQRLRSLEKCREQILKNEEKSSELTVGSVKERLHSLYKQNEADNKNNNCPCIFSKSINNYLLDKSSSGSDFDLKLNRATLDWKPKDEISDRSSSPEAEIYMNKLNMFNRDLDNLMYTKLPIDDYYTNSNYPASTSSIDLMGASSDREDSGIHTADVSCSVSQADEPVEDTDLTSTMLPHCIEKLKIENNKTDINESSEYNKQTSDEDEEIKDTLKSDIRDIENESEIKTVKNNLKDLIAATEEFLCSAKKDSTENLEAIAKEQLEESEITPNLDNKSVIYENVEIRPLNLKSENPVPIDCITIDLFNNPPKAVEPPKVKPPPPPPPDDEVQLVKPTSTNIKRLNSTKRIKKELHMKRSTFLGLNEPTDDQIEPNIPIVRPPDINVFLQTESKLEKTLYKKMQESQDGELIKVESQDSGLDIERGRLSSDTWCSSIGDSSHGRQDSEPTNSTVSEEDEITKKEREIIEMVEKEEKSRDNIEYINQNCDGHIYENQLGIENDKDTYLLSPEINHSEKDIQDSEVLKVEHQLLQLEKEELERQRENLLFRESCAKAKLQNNRHSLENICENLNIYPQYDGTNYRKSMPELQIVSNDCCKSTSNVQTNFYKLTPHLGVLYRKSFPENDLCRSFDHRKSMPELQQEVQRIPINRQPILPGKPIRPHSKEHKDRELNTPNLKQTRPISRHNLQALSAVPRQRHVPNDNWIQPRVHNETKSYNQHWLFQEAELRRISEQQKNASLQNRNWLQSRQEKHIPDAVIQTLTQRVQNRTGINDRNPNFKRSENNSKDYIQRPYLGNKQTLGYASPMSYPPPIALDDSQDRVLSVSGKKKCSYCGNELGRGAAMIIESLCLFYHMECFKCCVCHVQLGDGLMGTDVRVRNQKLHCHNCYSSDDGVKFSCV